MSTINKLPFSNQFERGRSFNWAGDWKVGRYYYNDEYVTDFVVYNSNVVLSCRESHTATEETEPELVYDESGKIIGVNSSYWSFVLHSETPNAEEIIALVGNYFATKEELSGKQDIISDLNEIRAGAAAGATAVQPADSPFEPGTGTNSVQQKGTGATATNTGAVAEGVYTTASGQAAHSEGAKYESNINTTAAGDASHAEGASTQTKGQASHSEGLLTTAGRTQAEAVAALSNFPNLSGTTEQKVSKLIGFASHAEGSNTQALGTSSHAEGNSTQALVNSTHAEGDTTTASGEAAHSEGYKTTASGNQAHAEGYNTKASANQAHAEGKYTEATSENAHAEGNNTTANGNASHTEGYYTVADNNVEHAEGQYNKSNTGDTTAEKTIHSIGIGNSSKRKNAVEVMQNGDVYIKDLGSYDGTNPISGTNDLKTIVNGKEQLSNKITTITASSTDDQYASAKATWDLVNAIPSMKLEIALNNTIVNDPTGTIFTSGAVYDELKYLFENPDKCIIKFDIDTTPPGMLADIRHCFYCDNKEVDINIVLGSGTSTISYTSLLYYNNSFNALILNIERETGTIQHQDETIWYIRFTVSYTINTL